MLFSFNRYTKFGLINKFIKNKQNIQTYSIFSRKNYFRSLLGYINVCYSNFLTPCESNYFYIWRFVILYLTNKNPSFYFKKTSIK